MRGAAYGFVLLCLAGPALGILLFGASSTAFFPEPEDFRISLADPAEIRFELREAPKGASGPGKTEVPVTPDGGALPVTPEGAAVPGDLEEIHLHLSGDLRRRPIELEIEEAATGFRNALEVEPGMQRRQYRHYRLEAPLARGRSGPLTLHMVFQDGPALEDGRTREGAFRDLVIIARHGLVPSEALANYRFLKPVPRPALLTLAALACFAVLAAVLLRSIFAPGSDSGAKLRNR